MPRGQEVIMQINYKPVDGWAADFIPFYWQGEYHLFYLKDFRDVTHKGEGTPWCHLVTKDFVTFTDYGEILARGAIDDQDLYVFTGCVIHAQGQFHIFYTGHNPYWRLAGRPEQAILHAVSDDLYHWQKIPGHIWKAPADRYEQHDWRDPFVFWNPTAQEYWMAVAVRLKDGPSRRRGCTGLCASKDLVTWEVREPLYAPDLYYTHECPDIFQIGDWWYLLFSEFSEACVTRYRMARSVSGPWLTPDVDTFDGRAFYAAKTAGGEGRRYLFGWNPTQTGAVDYADWNWGGNLVVHEIFQHPDGALGVRIPPTVRRFFGVEKPARCESAFKTHLPAGNELRLESKGVFRCASLGHLPRVAMLEVNAVFSQPTQGFGVMLRHSQDFESGYYVRIEPNRQRLVFDSWPRRGDLPHMLELERPLQISAGQPVHMLIYVNDTLCEVYVNNQVAMSARMYNHRVGNWGFFASEGIVSFTDFHLYAP
jgi:beta-fructofuranosidase